MAITNRSVTAKLGRRRARRQSKVGHLSTALLKPIAGYLKENKHSAMRSSLLISIAVHAAILIMLAFLVFQSIKADDLLIESRMDPRLGEELVESRFELVSEVESIIDNATAAKVSEILKPGTTETMMSNHPAPFAISNFAIPTIESIEGIDLSAPVPGQGIMENGVDSDGSDPSGAGATGESGEITNRLDKAGAKTGDVQVSLMWHNGNDLDLYVRCPSGEVIAFAHKQSQCGGTLDVDMNAAPPLVMKPVENIFWPKGSAPHGQFQVQVHHFANFGFRDPTHFQVAVKIDGKTTILRGVVSNGQAPVHVHAFNYPPTKAELQKLEKLEESNKIAAQEMLNKAKKYLNSPKVATPRLNKIIEQYPETDAAAEARKLLDSLPR